MRRLALLVPVVALAAVLAGTSAAVAQTGPPELSASPSSLAVGDTGTVTATGLGGLETAVFGLGDASGAVMLSADGSTYDTTAQSPVTSGNSSVFIMASAEGTYTVTVGDGENVLATTTVTVTGGGSGGGGATLTASPTTIAAGGEVTITASGLGGLETAQFGLGGGSDDGELNPTSAPVSDGTATTTFTASTPGTYTIDVTDGENPLAQVEVTVTAATPTATPTPSPTATPEPAPAQGGVPLWVVILIVVLALLVIAAILITVLVQARRRRGPAA